MRRCEGSFEVRGARIDCTLKTPRAKMGESRNVARSMFF